MKTEALVAILWRREVARLNILGFFIIKAGDGKLPHGYSVGKKRHCCHEEAKNEDSRGIEVGYIHHERGISVGGIVSSYLGVF